MDVELQKGCRIGAWFFGGVSAVGKVWLVIWLTCHSMLFLMEEFWGQVTGCHLGIMSSVGGDLVQALNDHFSRFPELNMSVKRCSYTVHGRDRSLAQTAILDCIKSVC